MNQEIQIQEAKVHIKVKMSSNQMIKKLNKMMKNKLKKEVKVRKNKERQINSLYKKTQKTWDK